MSKDLLHATTVALTGQAVLLRGSSGAGKSDFALRLIDRGWSLISDDQTELWREDDRLWVKAPRSIRGQMELRGVGIRQVAAESQAEALLLVDLKPADELERMPEARTEPFFGIALACAALDPFARSSEVKLEYLLRETLSKHNERNNKAAARKERPVMAEAGQPASQSQHRIVVVTGMSGAGRSSTLKALEDLGYEAIDNLPLDMMARVLPVGDDPRSMAIGVDIRTRSFAADPVLQQLDAMASRDEIDCKLLFLDCEDDVLVRRFSETRRPHPLAEDRPIADGIAAERRLVAPLLARADLVVDTSRLSPTNLRQVLRARLDLDRAPGMAIFVMSFSYRGGLPRQADLVFDARFLANPHYEEELRSQTGQDPGVAEFVTKDPAFKPYFEELKAWLAPQIPRFEVQNKSYLTLAVGCTGGKHRSVVVAEALAEWLRGESRPVILAHRDLERAGRGTATE